jgi:hypothetical protein
LGKPVANYGLYPAPFQFPLIRSLIPLSPKSDRFTAELLIDSKRNTHFTNARIKGIKVLIRPLGSCYHLRIRRRQPGCKTDWSSGKCTRYGFDETSNPVPLGRRKMPSLRKPSSTYTKARQLRNKGVKSHICQDQKYK